MDARTIETDLVAGAWAGVRRHPKKILPVEWGVFKTRYCLAGPSRVCYFKRSNLTAEPDEVVVCDGIQRHPENARVACLQHGEQAVAWLMFQDASTCGRFVAAAFPAIRALPMDATSINGYTLEQHRRAAMELQLLQAQLARQQETELSPFRRSRPPEDGPSHDMALSKSAAHSFPARRAGRAGSLSRSSSSSSEDDIEPLAPALSRGVVMDWPLSRAEKKVRLMQIMDRERTAIARQNRHLRRKSCPERMQCTTSS